MPHRLSGQAPAACGPSGIHPGSLFAFRKPLGILFVLVTGKAVKPAWPVCCRSLLPPTCGSGNRFRLIRCRRSDPARPVCLCPVSLSRLAGEVTGPGLIRGSRRHPGLFYRTATRARSPLVERSAQFDVLLSEGQRDRIGLAHLKSDIIVDRGHDIVEPRP